MQFKLEESTNWAFTPNTKQPISTASSCFWSMCRWPQQYLFLTACPVHTYSDLLFYICILLFGPNPVTCATYNNIYRQQSILLQKHKWNLSCLPLYKILNLLLCPIFFATESLFLLLKISRSCSCIIIFKQTLDIYSFLGTLLFCV